ncbi:MAG: hypothetical protein DME17_19600 [Candidatus Rokuibacteriota bacterium]|nr:MAG: hypothetical protein DME17_19600 [Candidatus Rokubacteria bacterium]
MESLRDHALVVIGPSNRVESTTPAAERWLEELAELGPPDPARLPHTVQAIANEARRLAKSEENSGQSQSRARTRHGEWVTLHASIVGEGADQRVIVFIEPSGPWEVASLILRAYGLTRREGELVRLVLHGFDTEQAADILNISPYTVQDHLKSIFAKIGVGSRKELVARLFFTHYLPRIQSGLFLGPDGWFVERNDQLVVGPESRARLGSQR